MTIVRMFTLAHDEARRRVAEFARQASAGMEVIFREPKRTSEQNALMWSWLTCFSDQLQWPVNGLMERLTPTEWKDILTAAYSQELQRVAPGLNGGMVLLGMRTSDMGKRQMAEFIDFIEATAADRGVVADWMAPQHAEKAAA